MKEEAKWTKTQLAFFAVTILLTIDEINPVKIILQQFPSINAWHIATTCLVLMVYIIISDIKNLLYFAVKTFIHSILSIFFRNIEIIGRDNIPTHGPVIFTGNHANQFVDGALLMCTNQHKLSLLLAEASWKRRIIGDLAWCLGAVPVKRAQDEARPLTGKIQFSQPSNGVQEAIATGTDTIFTKELKPGDKLRPPKSSFGFKVKSVESDTKLTLDTSAAPEDFAFPSETPTGFDILPQVPLQVVFEKVLVRLASGGCLGIFPEGGSHDRTDLLPLKVGVALIAYSALERDGLNIPIVPVGLSYFGAHRWRGRVVVEYGRPISIDPSTLPEFKKGGESRRKVCNKLLEDIESSMRSVIVSAPDYETLQVIHAARRLYQTRTLDTSQRQDLSRRFAEGYKRLVLMTDGNPPQEWLDLQNRIKSYQKELKQLGLKDYQVPALVAEDLDEVVDFRGLDGDKLLSVLQLLYHIVHLVVLLAVALIPTLFLNLPVGVLAGIYSEQRRKRALAKSRVKIRGYDVMLTEKIVFCLAMVPLLWVIYGVLLLRFTDIGVPAAVLAWLLMPLFSYTGIVVVDAGMIGWRDLRPYLVRLLPSSRARLAKLPRTRRDLQRDLRAFIRKIGPVMGELYYGKDLDWKAIQEASRQAAGTQEDLKKVK